ncbi:MAG: hypothetical protein DDT22_00121 [candidate division WS2 bacterium]|nr:hypothetical protein [Candidatus Lithacetigena glycinireducens]MBT9174467.1 hypothetical protein [Candidatus Lithacetigena glycinireducens]
MHPLVVLAKEAVELYLTEGRKPSPAIIDELGYDYRLPAPCFVTIRFKGKLRGCIGTISSTQENIALEIIENAIKSATRDPRFPPIQTNEIPYLTYSIDMLGPLQEVSDISRLNPLKYGVVVEKGLRRGVLLPDLESIDSVEQQLRLARLKAGIDEDDEINIYFFEVQRLE